MGQTVTRRPAGAGQWDGCVLAHAATRLCARWWRAPAALFASLTAPEGRGCAPLPPDPYPRQAELAGICALRARAALRAGVFLCWRMQRPACVRAGGALLPRCSLRSQPPRAGAARPYPRTPARGKLSLQAFARCARVLRFAQGVLCWRMWRPACLCWRMVPPAVFRLSSPGRGRVRC